MRPQRAKQWLLTMAAAACAACATAAKATLRPGWLAWSLRMNSCKSLSERTVSLTGATRPATSFRRSSTRGYCSLRRARGRGQEGARRGEGWGAAWPQQSAGLPTHGQTHSMPHRIPKHPRGRGSTRAAALARRHGSLCCRQACGAPPPSWPPCPAPRTSTTAGGACQRGRQGLPPPSAPPGRPACATPRPAPPPRHLQQNKGRGSRTPVTRWHTVHRLHRLPPARRDGRLLPRPLQWGPAPVGARSSGGKRCSPGRPAKLARGEPALADMGQPSSAAAAPQPTCCPLQVKYPQLYVSQQAVVVDSDQAVLHRRLHRRLHVFMGQGREPGRAGGRP